MGITPRKAYWCEHRLSWIIPLSRGYEALIDESDVARVTEVCWSAYPVRDVVVGVCPNNLKTKRGSQYLHHFALGIQGKGYVRARNGNMLDCRKANLSHNEPLYELSRGILVMAEVAPNKSCPYWRVYVQPNALLPGKVTGNGWVFIRRSRAIKTAELGRIIASDEHVHHKNENREDDRSDNLEILKPSEHNTHHKTGAKHTEDTKARIATSVKRTKGESRASLR